MLPHSRIDPHQFRRRAVAERHGLVGILGETPMRSRLMHEFGPATMSAAHSQAFQFAFDGGATLAPPSDLGLSPVALNCEAP